MKTDRQEKIESIWEQGYKAGRKEKLKEVLNKLKKLQIRDIPDAETDVYELVEWLEKEVRK